MRSLSFVDCLQFSDIYTNTSRNLCLYDVDNDGDNEFIIGFWDSGPLLENGEADAENSKGSLCVIKHRRIWKANNELGMVLCVTAGNVVGPNEPWILALCADSHCYAFNATVSDKSPHLVTSPCDSKSPSNKDKSQPPLLKMVHHQHLAYNAKDICILNTENSCDIAVAHSDRVVRLYTWCPSDQPTSSNSLRGKFIILIKWELAGQVNRVDTHRTFKWGTLLIASQPGGAFAILQRKFEKYKDNLAPTLVYYPPRVGNTRNVEARTWIVGNVRCLSSPDTLHESERCPKSGISPTSDSGSIMAVCMADGTVLFLDPTVDDDVHRVLWCIQLRVRGELFGLSKVNLTGSKTDEVCACAWDGTTYVLNHRKEWFRFPMGQSCQAFTAGWYAVEPGRNEPVFVYTTCERSLLIYYNLNVKNISARSLSDAIATDKTLVKKLEELEVNPQNRVQLQKTVRHLLYELPKSMSDTFDQ